MERIKESEELVAYHEAGHALVAYALGVKFDYVTIEPDYDEGCSGRMISSLDDSYLQSMSLEDLRVEDVRGIEDDITVFFAGVIAQSMAGGIAEHHGEHDIACTRQLASFVCETDSQVDSCMEWLRRRAELILADEKYLMCLGNLVHVLLERKRLTYEQVIRVFQLSLEQYAEITGSG